MAEKIKIGGELEAVTQDGKLADAAQVVDSTQNKTQELINSEVKEKLDAVINTDGSVKIPTITLSGDVTGSGTTAISGTIANSAVTTAKIANSAVTNAKLANSSVTIGNKSVSLGGTLTDIDTSGTLTASTIKKSGGTSAQFLKADGSVDSNSYATTSAIPTKVSALTNDAGYLTTHQDISGKVDKVSGKGLSTNDYTDAERNKLSGIADNANNYTLPTASGSVLGGVKVGEGLSISNGVLNVSQDTDTRILYHAAQAPSSIATTYTGTYYVLADKNIAGNTTAAVIAYYSNGTAVNELTISAGEVRQCADGTRWQASGTGWTQIKSGVNVVQTTGTSTEDVMSQKAVTDELAKKVDAVSGKGLSTNDYTTAEKTKLSGIAEGANKTTVDSALSSSSTNPVQNKVVNTALGNKVDKVDGKGLSTNDYTTDEKTKLANIEAAANRTVVDSAISSTSTNPVTSKAISTALASKVDAVSGKSLSTNDYTTAEKTKLAGIAEGANKTTVDTALSTTSTNPVTNKAVTEALAEKADASSYVKLVLKGVAEAYYANASSIPSSAADGNYICDTGSSSTIKRCITIRAGGAVVNDVTATNGDFWLSKADGHVYAAVSNNTTSWVDCGKLQGEKGDKGDKGADGADGTDGIDGAQTVVQTTGTSTTDVMSQAASLKIELKTSHAQYMQYNQQFGVILTNAQAERINRNSVITVVMKMIHDKTGPSYCGVRVPPSSRFTTLQTIDGLTYFNGLNFVKGSGNNGYHFQSTSASQPVGGTSAYINIDKPYCGCLMFVLNRDTGWAYIYNETGALLGSRHHASMIYPKFIENVSEYYLQILGGESKYVCEVAIYDGDISQFGTLNMFVNPPSHDSSEWTTYITTPSVGNIYSANKWVLNEDDGLYHITKTAATKNMAFETFWYYTSNYGFTCYKKIKINSGTAVFPSTTKWGGSGNGSIHVYNEANEEVTGDTLSAGIYSIYATAAHRGVISCSVSAGFDMNFIEGSATKVSCCFKIDNFVNKYNCVYEVASDSLIKMHKMNDMVDRGEISVNTSSFDLHSVEPSGAIQACYIGATKYGTDGKIYMVASDYTWKQINNS